MAFKKNDRVRCYYLDKEIRAVGTVVQSNDFYTDLIIEKNFTQLFVVGDLLRHYKTHGRIVRLVKKKK